jgi:hypothetical protein
MHEKDCNHNARLASSTVTRRAQISTLWRLSGISVAARVRMRPARLRTTTLADVQSGTRAEICAVCRQTLRAGEPLAWGLAHERLHERCLDGLRASRLRPKERPQRVAPAMRGVLARHEGRLCMACLAMEINVSLQQAREVVARIATSEGFAVLPVSCGRCGRQTDALCTVPHAA